MGPKTEYQTSLSWLFKMHMYWNMKAHSCIILHGSKPYSFRIHQLCPLMRGINMPKWHFNCFITFRLCELIWQKMHAKLKLCTQTIKQSMAWNLTPLMTFPHDHNSFPNPISGCCCKSRKICLQNRLWQISLAQTFKMHTRAIEMMNSCKFHL